MSFHSLRGQAFRMAAAWVELALLTITLLLFVVAEPQAQIIENPLPPMSPFNCKELGWVIDEGRCFPPPCRHTTRDKVYEEIFDQGFGQLLQRLSAPEKPDPSKLTSDSKLCNGIPLTPFGSVDPNDKVGSPGVTGNRFLLVGKPLAYTIFFENLETATAAAQDVVISDQLDVLKMDLGTFSLGPIAIGGTTIIPPPGLSQFIEDIDLRPAQQLIVRINASLDKASGIVTWRFVSLDPNTLQPTEDLFAGFLPPNVNSPEGEGSVLFTVMPREGLLTGTQVCNQASIVFDTNLPILTPAWCNTVDGAKPISAVQPLAPVQSSSDFTVEWTGTDEGSGVAGHVILVSEDGVPFGAVISDSTQTSATFSGQRGRTYAFYAVAVDAVGNVEELRTVADAVTIIGGDGGLVCDTDGDNDVDLVDINAINAARNTPASLGDPRDANGDGTINVIDSRFCVVRRTN